MKPFRGKRMPQMYLRGCGLVCAWVEVLRVQSNRRVVLAAYVLIATAFS